MGDIKSCMPLWLIATQTYIMLFTPPLLLLGEESDQSQRRDKYSYNCGFSRSPRNVQYEKMVEGGQLQEAQAISVLHEMLQQSFNLFHTERSSAAWDTTLLEQLRTGLHQQLDHLDACLGQVMGEEDSGLGRTGPTLAVKRYFQGIHVYLQEKEYSDCAWETVRVEIMRSLSSSASL